MLGRSTTINRVANSSETPYRSSPVHHSIAQPHNYYHSSSTTVDSRDAASPTSSTITPSAPSSVASHTPPYSSSLPLSHDVPAYVQSIPHQPYNSNYHRPYRQSPDASSTTMTPASSQEVGNAGSMMPTANPRYYPTDYQAPPSGAPPLATQAQYTCPEHRTYPLLRHHSYITHTHQQDHWEAPSRLPQVESKSALCRISRALLAKNF